MRKLDLTAEHVALVHRTMPDQGIAPGAQLQSDADYAEWVERIIASHPDRSAPTRLFAYGSLIWKPEIPHTGEAVGVARGWHRSFCYRMTRFRGTVDQPGLMMALERGGQCKGVVYELPREDLEVQLAQLFRREFTFKPANTVPRWIVARTSEGEVPALAFVINRLSPNYAGRLSPQEVAEVLSQACGHWGTGAEYLLNTVTQLEQKGIRDSNLWRLQKLVAQCIERDHGPALAG
jgi:cation transport protein ChaC